VGAEVRGYSVDHQDEGHVPSRAQTRYLELTGWPARSAGGPRSKELTPTQREIDQEARLRISQELAHEREQITAICL
jgi:hypothetical protein